MNVGDLIESDNDKDVSGFVAGDLVIMPQYHGEHKFLVLGGQALEMVKAQWKTFVEPGDVVLLRFDPNYEGFMTVHSIAAHKVKKVGSIGS